MPMHMFNVRLKAGRSQLRLTHNTKVTRAQLLLRWPRKVAQVGFSL